MEKEGVNKIYGPYLACLHKKAHRNNKRNCPEHEVLNNVGDKGLLREHG